VNLNVWKLGDPHPQPNSQQENTHPPRQFPTKTPRLSLFTISTTLTADPQDSSDNPMKIPDPNPKIHTKSRLVLKIEFGPHRSSSTSFPSLRVPRAKHVHSTFGILRRATINRSGIITWELRCICEMAG
jgi:hypothetical protein